MEEAALAAGAAAWGPGAVGSFGGGEGGCLASGAASAGEGASRGAAAETAGTAAAAASSAASPGSPGKWLWAGRAAKFPSARRGAGCLGQPAPNSPARPPPWSPWLDPRVWGLILLWAVQKVEAGAGRRRRLPLCGSPPLPHPVRATSPPSLRPPSLLPLAGLPFLARLGAEGHGPCPFG